MFAFPHKYLPRQDLIYYDWTYIIYGFYYKQIVKFTEKTKVELTISFALCQDQIVNTKNCKNVGLCASWYIANNIIENFNSINKFKINFKVETFYLFDSFYS